MIVDEDGTYEPRHPNDRLLLGMKGTMSELELSLLRARSMEALKQKARRGELFFTVSSDLDLMMADLCGARPGPDPRCSVV